MIYWSKKESQINKSYNSLVDIQFMHIKGLHECLPQHSYGLLDNEE